MGREQGDHLAERETVTYVGTVNGVEYERKAVTPADHINLRARGWVRTTSTSGAANPTPDDSTTDQPANDEGQSAAKRGGRRAPEAVSAAPQDEVAAAAGGTA